MFTKTQKEKTEDDETLLHIFILWERNNKASRDLAVSKYRKLKNHNDEVLSRNELAIEYKKFIS